MVITSVAKIPGNIFTSGNRNPEFPVNIPNSDYNFSKWNHPGKSVGKFRKSSNIFYTMTYPRLFVFQGSHLAVPTKIASPPMSENQLVNSSQLHQSRLGLLSQALMMIIATGFLFSETLEEFWKTKQVFLFFSFLLLRIRGTQSKTHKTTYHFQSQSDEPQYP